eukprot:2859260-Prymnesium_polylepis.1
MPYTGECVVGTVPSDVVGSGRPPAIEPKAQDRARWRTLVAAFCPLSLWLLDPSYGRLQLVAHDLAALCDRLAVARPRPRHERHGDHAEPARVQRRRHARHVRTAQGALLRLLSREMRGRCTRRPAAHTRGVLRCVAACWMGGHAMRWQ